MKEEVLKKKINILEKELNVFKKKLVDLKRNNRANRYLIILKQLKKECGEKGFSYYRFIKKHKIEYNFILAVQKLGLMEVSNEEGKNYKWVVGTPIKSDVNYIIDFVNLKAKERRNWRDDT